MRKIVIAIMLLTASPALGAADAFIVNSLAETLSRIDLETGIVQNHVTLLGDTPNQIECYRDYLYVVNSVSAVLQKIDPANNQTVIEIPLEVGSNPYSVAFDGTHAFVTGWASGFVYRIDLTTNAVDNQIMIGGFPEGMIVSAGRLFVAQTGFNPVDFSYGQGRMAVINPSSMTLEDEVDIGKNPQSFVAISDTIIHAVCTGDYGLVGGTIYICNTRTASVVDSILTGGQPVNGALAPGHIVFLAAGGWESHGIVLAYNAETGQIINGIGNPIVSGLGASDMAVDAMGYVYTCNFGDDTVSKISRQAPPFPPYGVGDGPVSIAIVDTRTTDVADEEPPSPAQLTMLTNYPNPFNGRTTIKYNLGGNSEGRINIYDIHGRFVREFSVNAPSGLVTWDGMDADGRSCSSGIYLAALEIAGENSDEYTHNRIAIAYVK
jgi:YVTN family beta-propeller protein